MTKPIMDIIEIRKPSNWLLMSDVEREEWEESLKYKVSKAQQLMDDRIKIISLQKEK